MQSTVKVGILVVAFAAMLLGAYAILGRAMFARRTITVHADFPDAGGTSVGTPVLIAGVQIGHVKRVSLVSPTLARLTINLEREHQVPVGTTAFIAASLIGVGENPVQLVPPERPGREWLVDGSVILGRKGSPLEGVLPNAEQVMDELAATLAASRRLLEDEELTGNLKDLLRATTGTVEAAQTTMVAANQTLARFGGIADQTGAMIAENRIVVRQAVQEAALAMQNVREASEVATRMLRDGRLEGETIALLESLTRTSAQAEKLIANLDQAVSDPELRQPLAQSAKNLADMTETGTRIARNTEAITERGIVVTDRAIELTERATDVAEEAKRVLQQIGGFFQRGTGAPALAGIETQMDIMRGTEPNRWRTDITVTAPLPDGRVHFGLFDAFESNRINLQLGRPLGDRGEYRYGIYASKPGLGVDFQVAPKLFLRGDLFDINDPRMDLRARYEFGRGFVGWFGVDRMFDRNSPMIGVGIRR
jgi:phospholipid/cholesterol/gamma-HCH transport system substrate-binding protein